MGDAGLRYNELRGQRRTIRNLFFVVIIGGIILSFVSSALWERYRGSAPQDSQIGTPRRAREDGNIAGELPRC
mgnify:CR=1 FL=1